MSNGRLRKKELPIAEQVRELSLETVLRWVMRTMGTGQGYGNGARIGHELLISSLTHPTVCKVFGISAFTSTADICNVMHSVSGLHGDCMADGPDLDDTAA